MPEILQMLQENREGDLLPWLVQNGAAKFFNTSVAEIEAIALDNQILPSRYQRNRNMISVEQQRKLFGCTVAVVGCGALGGYVLEQLSRLGVGHLVAIDPDTFEEHNLNRQFLSSCKNLGQAKVQAAANRNADINPAVTFTAHQQAFNSDNGNHLLSGADVVVDCVDTINCRLDLAHVCRQLSVPLVHGAIAGWSGQICTVFPEDYALESIYRHQSTGTGVEKTEGNPSFTPAVIGSLEVAEACKVLLDLGSTVSGRTLRIDLLDMEFDEIPL